VSNTPASWFCPAVYELARWHGVALAIADRRGLDVQSLELTADFTPIRFHHGLRGRGRCQALTGARHLR